MRPQVWYYGCCHCVFLDPEVTILKWEGDAREGSLIGSDWVVVTCQSQGSHALKHTLLYHLFYCKWDHNLQNVETTDWDHKLSRKLFTDKREARQFVHEVTHNPTGVLKPVESASAGYQYKGKFDWLPFSDFKAPFTYTMNGSSISSVAETEIWNSYRQTAAVLINRCFFHSVFRKQTCPNALLLECTYIKTYLQ